MKRTLALILSLMAMPLAQAETLNFYGDDGTLPFSTAVQAGNLLFISGSIGNKPGTEELVAGGIQPETRQAMEHIKAAVEKYGSHMDRVVKCTVFMADIKEWAAMNEVYVSYFPKHKPARSALGASGLALNARVEIECIAALYGSR